MGAGASSAAAGADAQAGRRAPAPAPATEPATAAGRAASAPAAAGATAAGTGASEGRASRGAGRQRLAYRGPTLGGALGGARPAAPGALSAQGAPAREPPRAPAVPAQAQTQALHAGAAHLRAPRGRSTLVTAGGLVNSSDIDSIVKQRRHAKKVPSAASLQAEERTERPGSAHARLVRSRAAKGDATSRPWSGRRKEGEEVWSDDDDTVDRLREAARQQCAASNKHLEARLRNVAQHFRVTPSAARETARALVLGGLRVQADTADSRPSSGGRGGSAGEGGSAMRPAPPPQSARGGQQAAPAPIAAA